MNTCPRCKSTEFKIIIEPDDFIRKGKPYIANVEHSLCTDCNWEVIFPEQIRRNDAILLEIWREIDLTL